MNIEESTEPTTPGRMKRRIVREGSGTLSVPWNLDRNSLLNAYAMPSAVPITAGAA